METLTYAQAKDRPLSSDCEIEERLRALLGHAIREQLWALFLDERDCLRELIIPVDELPARPDEKVDYLVESLGEIARMQGGGSLVLVRERPGAVQPTQTDSAWSAALSLACERHEVGLRMILLCHSEGVSCMHSNASSVQ